MAQGQLQGSAVLTLVPLAPVHDHMPEVRGCLYSERVPSTPVWGPVGTSSRFYGCTAKCALALTPAVEFCVDGYNRTPETTATHGHTGDWPVLGQCHDTGHLSLFLN